MRNPLYTILSYLFQSDLIKILLDSVSIHKLMYGLISKKQVIDLSKLSDDLILINLFQAML